MLVREPRPAHPQRDPEGVADGAGNGVAPPWHRHQAGDDAVELAQAVGERGDEDEQHAPPVVAPLHRGDALGRQRQPGQQQAPADAPDEKAQLAADGGTGEGQQGHEREAQVLPRCRDPGGDHDRRRRGRDAHGVQGDGAEDRGIAPALQERLGLMHERRDPAFGPRRGRGAPARPRHRPHRREQGSSRGSRAAASARPAAPVQASSNSAVER